MLHFCHKRIAARSVKAQASVKFSVIKPTYYGAQVRVIGSSDALGAWEAAKGLNLEWSEGDEWTGQCELTEPGPTEFKYVMVYSPEDPESEFEWSGPDGSNFSLEVPSQGSVQIVSSWDGEILSMDVSSEAAPAPEPEPEPIVEAPPPLVIEASSPVVAEEEIKAEPVPAVTAEAQVEEIIPAPLIVAAAEVEESAVMNNIVEAPVTEAAPKTAVKRGRKASAIKERGQKANAVKAV